VEEREQDSHTHQGGHGAYKSYEFRKQNKRSPAFRMILRDPVV